MFSNNKEINQSTVDPLVVVSVNDKVNQKIRNTSTINNNDKINELSERVLILENKVTEHETKFSSISENITSIENVSNRNRENIIQVKKDVENIKKELEKLSNYDKLVNMVNNHEAIFSKLANVDANWLDYLIWMISNYNTLKKIVESNENQPELGEVEKWYHIMINYGFDINSVERNGKQYTFLAATLRFQDNFNILLADGQGEMDFSIYETNIHDIKRIKDTYKYFVYPMVPQTVSENYYLGLVYISTGMTSEKQKKILKYGTRDFNGLVYIVIGGVEYEILLPVIGEKVVPIKHIGIIIKVNLFENDVGEPRIKELIFPNFWDFDESNLTIKENRYKVDLSLDDLPEPVYSYGTCFILGYRALMGKLLMANCEAVNDALINEIKYIETMHIASGNDMSGMMAGTVALAQIGNLEANVTKKMSIEISIPNVAVGEIPIYCDELPISKSLMSKLIYVFGLTGRSMCASYEKVEGESRDKGWGLGQNVRYSKKYHAVKHPFMEGDFSEPYYSMLPVQSIIDIDLEHNTLSIGDQSMNTTTHNCTYILDGNTYQTEIKFRVRLREITGFGREIYTTEGKLTNDYGTGEEMNAAIGFHVCDYLKNEDNREKDLILCDNEFKNVPTIWSNKNGSIRPLAIPMIFAERPKGMVRWNDRFLYTKFWYYYKTNIKMEAKYDLEVTIPIPNAVGGDSFSIDMNGEELSFKFVNTGQGGEYRAVVSKTNQNTLINIERKIGPIILDQSGKYTDDWNKNTHVITGDTNAVVNILGGEMLTEYKVLPLYVDYSNNIQDFKSYPAFQEFPESMIGNVDFKNEASKYSMSIAGDKYDFPRNFDVSIVDNPAPASLSEFKICPWNNMTKTDIYVTTNIKEVSAYTKRLHEWYPGPAGKVDASIIPVASQSQKYVWLNNANIPDSDETSVGRMPFYNEDRLSALIYRKENDVFGVVTNNNLVGYNGNISYEVEKTDIQGVLMAYDYWVYRYGTKSVKDGKKSKIEYCIIKNWEDIHQKLVTMSDIPLEVDRLMSENYSNAKVKAIKIKTNILYSPIAIGEFVDVTAQIQNQGLAGKYYIENQKDIENHLQTIDTRLKYIDRSIEVIFDNFKQMTQVEQEASKPSTLSIIATIMQSVGMTLGLFLPLIGTGVMLGGQLLSSIDALQHQDILNGALGLAGVFVMANYGAWKFMKKYFNIHKKPWVIKTQNFIKEKPKNAMIQLVNGTRVMFGRRFGNILKSSSSVSGYVKLVNEPETWIELEHRTAMLMTERARQRDQIISTMLSELRAAQDLSYDTVSICVRWDGKVSDKQGIWIRDGKMKSNIEVKILATVFRGNVDASLYTRELNIWNRNWIGQTDPESVLAWRKNLIKMIAHHFVVANQRSSSINVMDPLMQIVSVGRTMNSTHSMTSAGSIEVNCYSNTKDNYERIDRRLQYFIKTAEPNRYDELYDFIGLGDSG